MLSSEKNTKYPRATLCVGWTQAKVMGSVLVDLPNIPPFYRRSHTALGGATDQRTALESESRSQDELVEAAFVLTTARAKRDSAVAHKAATHAFGAPLAPISFELVTKVIDACFPPAIEEGAKNKKAKVIAVIKYVEGVDETLAVNCGKLWN